MMRNKKDELLSLNFRLWIRSKSVTFCFYHSSVGGPYCVHVCLPLANIGRISGLPQHQVLRVSLNTESNSTGFSFHPKDTNTQNTHTHTHTHTQFNDLAVTNRHNSSSHPYRHFYRYTSVKSSKYLFFHAAFSVSTYTPTFSNSTNILIEASDKSNMTGTGLSGHACVRHTPGTLLLNHTPNIGKHTQKCTY